LKEAFLQDRSDKGHQPLYKYKLSNLKSLSFSSKQRHDYSVIPQGEVGNITRWLLHNGCLTREE